MFTLNQSALPLAWNPWQFLPGQHTSHSLKIVGDYAELVETYRQILPLPVSLHKAVSKRQALFLAGRYCAQQAFLKAGFSIAPVIGQNEAGAPIWPENWVGSITHSDQLISALIAPRTQYSALGIDIEKIISAKTLAAVAERISLPVERSQAHPGLNESTYYSLLFSAKESLYKALYPSVKRFFGFEAAEVQIIDASQFQICLRETLTPEYPSGLCLKGIFRLAENHVFSLVFQ